MSDYLEYEAISTDGYEEVSIIVDTQTSHVPKKSKQVYELNNYSWNEHFQSTMEEIFRISIENVKYEEREKVWEHLSDLSLDFMQSAKSYGKIIVDELTKPFEQKTIRPLQQTNEDGQPIGVCGGDKYIVNGILFKFAIDRHSIFRGNEESTAKVAAHDLRSLNAYFHLKFEEVYQQEDKPKDQRQYLLMDNRLSFPICMLIDYKGFRLIALSLIPIKSDSTLIYGSNDSGLTVHDALSDGQRATLEKTSKMLNLCAHFVPQRSQIGAHKHFTQVDQAAKLLYSTADLEAHNGLDGRFYLLDFARSMPPQHTQLNSQFEATKRVYSSHLVFQLRPEFVRTLPFALNPDALSNFIRLPPNWNSNQQLLDRWKETIDRQYQQASQELQTACSLLIDQQIPQFARRLIATTQELSIMHNRHQLSIFVNDWFTIYLHSNGINVRYLAFVAKELQSIGEQLDSNKDSEQLAIIEFWRNNLLIELLSRVIKRLLNDRLRQRMNQSELSKRQQYFREVVDLFNQVFSHTSDTIWSESIVPKFVESYPSVRSHSLLSHFIDLSHLNPSGVDQQSFDLKRYLYSVATPFIIDQNEQVNALCLLFYRSAKQTGLKLTTQSLCELIRVDSQNEYATLKKSNISIFRRLLSVYDVRKLKMKIKQSQILAHSQGVILRMKASLNQSLLKHQPQLTKSASMRSSLNSSVSNSVSNLGFEDSPVSEMLFTKALKKFQQSLSSVTLDERTLRNVADVYLQLGMIKLAQFFYLFAIEVNPKASVSLYKYAYFLHHGLKDLDKAEIWYRKSIEVLPTEGALLTVAKFFISKENFTEAESCLNRAVEQFPNRHNAYLLLTDLFSQLEFKRRESNSQCDRDYVQLIEINFKKTLDLVPNEASIIQKYYDFLINIKEDLATADQIMEKYENTNFNQSSSQNSWRFMN